MTYLLNFDKKYIKVSKLHKGSWNEFQELGKVRFIVHLSAEGGNATTPQMSSTPLNLITTGIVLTQMYFQHRTFPLFLHFTLSNLALNSRKEKWLKLNLYDFITWESNQIWMK